MTITPGGYTAIGLVVVAIFVYRAKWYLGKALDSRFAKMQKLESDRERERIQEEELIMRGLRILSECDYELIYALKNGEHNGGIDSCLENVSKYKRDVDQWIYARAAKYGSI